MHVPGIQRYKCVYRAIAGTVAILTALTPRAAAQRIIAFNAPSAGTLAGVGTEPVAINGQGAVTGNVADNNGGVHGFVRSRDGRFVVFDAPSAVAGFAGTCQYGSGGTCPNAINNSGVVVGDFSDVHQAWHGFVRTPEGRMFTFDAPGAGTGQFQGTFVQSINSRGTMVGNEVDGNNVAHAFVRFADRDILVFDDPSAGTAPGQGTVALSINDEGTVIGVSTDASLFTHGMIRSQGGVITDFNPPASAGGNGVAHDFINERGMIAGTFYFPGTNVVNGFTGSAEGKMIDFQVPGAGSGGGEGAWIWSINSEGAIAGFVVDNLVECHSFVRYPSGTIVVFDIPGQYAPPGSFTGGGAFDINDEGVVVGHWSDVNGVVHGYLRFPE